MSNKQKALIGIGLLAYGTSGTYFPANLIEAIRLITEVKDE